MIDMQGEERVELERREEEIKRWKCREEKEWNWKEEEK